MRKLLPAIILLTLLAACATPYQDMGLSGGVSASIIDGTHARISARGNGFTDSATIQEYALLKAAQETLVLGKRYFAVISSTDATRNSQFTTPTQSYTTTTGTLTANTYGNYASGSYYGSSSTTTYGGQTFNIIKPGTDVIIQMYGAQEVDPKAPGVFDAVAIMQFLGSKYIKNGKR